MANLHPNYTPSFRNLLKKPVHLCAFGFGSGLLKPASGTWGSLLGALLLMPFVSYLHHPLSGSLFLLISYFIGIYFCGKTARDIGIHDHGGIVWDEFFGVWFVMITFPPILWTTWGLGLSTLSAFLLFRIFDIWKPWPISAIDQKTHGGNGIMLDDLAAAIVADLVLYLTSFAY